MLETKPKDRRLYAKTFQVGATREGESLAGAAKSSGPECVVSGGLGTTKVMHKGETYYVCCSGCLDAFKDDPEKYIKEFKAKKK
ncbi:MAG: YHS domain-containing protein [Planctomycetia bacterium]|nr:YHS domain-containing protein [Planctomycetia bacterium]